MSENAIGREVAAFVESFPAPSPGFRATVMSEIPAGESGTPRWRGVVAVAISVAVVVTLVLAGRGLARLDARTSARTTALPTTAPSTASEIGPMQISEVGPALIRARTGVQPVLLPAALPAGVTVARISYGPGFHVEYYRPGEASPVVSVRGGMIPSMLLPNQVADLADPNVIRQYRGVSASYVVLKSDPGHRTLQWAEPSAGKGVTYGISASGLSDEEFWAVANSMSPAG